MSTIPHNKLKAAIVIAISVCAVVLPIGLYRYMVNAHTAFESEDVTAIEVVILSRDASHKRVTHNYKTADRGTIDKFVELFRRRERVEDHKCARHGQILIRHHTSGIEELYIMRGHDSLFWEFRYDGVPYRVPREPFLGVMKDIGVEDMPGTISSQPNPSTP